MPELFHAQVTRSQGIFSIRSTYISYGLEYIAVNIKTPTKVLQYPTMRQFIRELKKGYDYVGISFVIATFEKVKKMVQAAREHAPHSKIILGGYGTVLPECEAYGDYICREEGVAFMRRLLEEVHDDSPPRHVVYPTSGKILGFPALKGAVILAGLGCPHGCEFCATSHFHGRKHIPLLRTGEDIYREIKRVHKTLGNAKLPIGIIEEDFLLQKKRAQEYLDCVITDREDPIHISCFASAYSISQWDPEDLVRMGIQSLWIGVESREAPYAKLKGLDVKMIFDTLHAHGINTLASLIIGHDFHTVEKVWDDFEYLMSMKPTLSQFLILGPTCNTPLFERLQNEGRLLDVPYPHYDGFHLMFRHPHISKEQMEQLILDVYDEEFKRLGPSAVRFVERQLSGYLRFKDASDALLRKRAEQYREGCLEALPLFPVAAHYAPTQEVAEKIIKIEHSIINQIGRGGVQNTVKAMIMPVLAYASKLRLKYGGYPQPTLGRTEYRMSEHTLIPVDLRGKGILQIKLRPRAAAHHPLVVDLHGVFDRITAAKLMKRIEGYLAKNRGHLAINFSGLTSIDRKALLMFFKKLRTYSERIKLVSIDYLKSEWDDIVNYAKSYFDVLIDEDSLASSLA
jgi:haloalkane dehalogenase